jgi:anaerobic magnesium-protoporphyrin IX monomethyl ester cyclase
MRIVLADLKALDGYASKDTTAGGYGSRLVPFSRVTFVYNFVKSLFYELPSIQLGYLAAIAADHGHEVVYTRDSLLEGDVILVLSSLVDHRHETAWADAARARGLRVGFLGLAASKVPELFAEHADFVIEGEPESAMLRLVEGERLNGLVSSPPVSDLDTLPFPRWDLLRERRDSAAASGLHPAGRQFPLLSSRSCPESCIYCSHRILAPYRARSVANIIEELGYLSDRYRRPYIVFRDALFTEQRDRCLELCDEIAARGISIRFSIETRLDRLDEELLLRLRRAGLETVNFGVESVSPEALRRVGRRRIPEEQQRAMVRACSELGIRSVAFYIFGFLTDTWESISSTIDYSISLGSTFAQYKLLTPYPGTALWPQMQDLIYEREWERFDGFTPTFHHPNLSAEELRFLLAAAYARFYMRPSFLADCLGLRNRRLRRSLRGLDRWAFRWHAALERGTISRAVSC